MAEIKQVGYERNCTTMNFAIYSCARVCLFVCVYARVVMCVCGGGSVCVCVCMCVEERESFN